jgi:hypothetical protein
VDVVGASDGKVERETEVEVRGLNGVEVEGQDGAGVGYDGFQFDGVDERFGEGGEFEGRVVEAVDVVPNCRYLLVSREKNVGCSRETYTLSSHPCTPHPQFQP